MYFDSFGIEYIRQDVLSNLSLAIYLEYMMMILLRMDFTVLLPYNIRLQEKFC